MKIPPLVLLFIAGAALSWGVYVPLVHEATSSLKSNLRAFLCVGLAYFLIAVLVPLLFIYVFNDPTVKKGAVPNFAPSAVAWGLAAGVSGALGALCVIFATNLTGVEGRIYIAPLVFGFAPIINTLATVYVFHPVKAVPDIRFFLGILLAAVGASLVMVYKPTETATKPVPAAATSDPASGTASH